jgi:hypothetical protein
LLAGDDVAATIEAMEEVRGAGPSLGEVDPHAGDVDVTLLWFTLSMTPAERLDYQDAARRSALEMRRAGRRHHGITGYDDLDPESSAPVQGSRD